MEVMKVPRVHRSLGADGGSVKSWGRGGLLITLRTNSVKVE